MTTHRRDLLKLFGVGASIIPIINGGPVMAAKAKLIEEPKVELVPDLNAHPGYMPMLAAMYTLDDAVRYFKNLYGQSPFQRMVGINTDYQHLLCLPHHSPALLLDPDQFSVPIAVWELRGTKRPGEAAQLS